MSKKNIINASNAAASFFSIKEEPEVHETAAETSPAPEAAAAKGAGVDRPKATESENGAPGAAAGSKKKRTAGRKKKEEVQEGYITRTYYITKELDKQLGHFCIEQGMDKSSVVRASLQAYMKKHSER